ncbi:MAG: L-arabinose isomerase [Oscillospiraceae bacterium]|jgi:L-arabinose isomerase|nr:L-arabinose isomerase [Oscillospiraceae bacterium]
MNFWFITGSQFLYGEETLIQVEKNSREIAGFLNEKLPFAVEYSSIVKTEAGAFELIKRANFDSECAGVIVYCHTFSPSKMWISALKSLQKPYLHLHTQYNRAIDNNAIDMDYMNLHQSAHGDREHGFIAARLNIAREIVSGHYKDADVIAQIENWQRASTGAAFSRTLKIARFGDNMREVAVTEGDKVEAQLKFGWQVNTYGVGGLVEETGAVSQSEIAEKMTEYCEKYEFKTDNLDSVREQARMEIAMRKILDRENCRAFTNTFEDLYGMEQLPGLATQNLMAQGFGYGGEGDWKTSALVAIAKSMSDKPSSFMEDYTYDYDAGLILGAHMLEVCPTIAADEGKPQVEVHALGIGGKNPPARLVFEGIAGLATCASLVDMGGRFRLIVQDVECVRPINSYPNLPVARVMWKPAPDLKTSAAAWICAGGAHHTVLSYGVSADMWRVWARIMEIEFVHLNAETNLHTLERELEFGGLLWKLKN